MWIYRQRTGELQHNEEHSAFGYSGYGEAKNRTEDQHRPGLGPIPCGAYLIGSESDDLKHGPCALHLLPLTGTQTFERSGFMVHGDSKDHPGAASHGCIIVGPDVRHAMRDGHDKLLVVIP